MIWCYQREPQIFGTQKGSEERILMTPFTAAAEIASEINRAKVLHCLIPRRSKKSDAVIEYDNGGGGEGGRVFVSL